MAKLNISNVMKNSKPNLPASSRTGSVGGGLKTPSLPKAKNTSLMKAGKKKGMSKKAC